MLNGQQKLAIETIKGPILIIAGAGSGKTRVLTHRIAYLIENGIKPWNILAVTFTNKAAQEMKDRLRKLLNISSDEALKVNMGTFHSICVRILRETAHFCGYENKFTIYDSADCLSLMKNIMNDAQIDPKKINPKAILNAISGAKNQLIDAVTYKTKAFEDFHRKAADLYLEYEKQLSINQAFDFDDLIMKTVEILEKNEEILEKFQDKFQYILVDEYQDTNHAQYVLTKMLAKKHRNLCVVGDSDQSIYSFRGANIQNILDFEKDYPETQIIKLEQNYRSTKNILKAAHNIIIKNKKRKEKEMWTENIEGEKIKIYKAINEREEGELIAREIRNILRQHERPAYNDFVILYRTNAQSRVIEETMLRNAIPYRIIGGVKFYERKEIKDILAYLKLIQNSNDSVSLLRIINTPSRKIGAQTLSQIQFKAHFTGMSLFETMRNPDFLSSVKHSVILNFVQLIDELKKANQEFPTSGVIKQVIHLSRYKEYLLSDNSKEAESRYENILELISVASKYDGLEPSISLATFLEEVALVSELDNLNNSDNAVTLMTLHSAKGLEFNNVFIVGTEEGLLPHMNSLYNSEELEEERRLMYVGITRAKENLYLLHTQQRLLYGEYSSKPLSQFVKDIDENLLEFNYIRENKKLYASSYEHYDKKPIPVENTFEIEYLFKAGDLVEHRYFGLGKILNITGSIATVAFEDPQVGIKKLALNVAPLTKLG